MRQLLFTILTTFFLADSFAQTDSLNYKFLDWYVTTLGQKRIYIDKRPQNISKYDLGTQKEYFQRTDTTSLIFICGLPVIYSQRIITAFDELQINYDTVVLNRQITNSYGSFLAQEKFKNGKVVSCWLLSPFNNSIFGRLFLPFRHRRTFTLSIPLWTDSNKYVVVKSSVLDRRPREKQSSIDIYQRLTDNSFKLIKRIDRQK